MTATPVAGSNDTVDGGSGGKVCRIINTKRNSKNQLAPQHLGPGGLEKGVLRPAGGKILEVSDGMWLIPGKRRKCYKK